MCEWIERGKENRWEEIEGKRKLGSSRNKASKVGWNISNRSNSCKFEREKEIPAKTEELAFILVVFLI